MPYTTTPAFPSLRFERCLDITNAPGSQRLFVVEQGGKIFSFPNRQDVRTADLVVDIPAEIPGAREVYALTFHPDFQKNRYCFVCYIKAARLEDGTHVARFRMTDTNPPRIDPSSETTVITWLSGGHNGCCLKFGPDGYLYISTGDGEGPNPPDIRRTGQDVSDLLSSILRIDVDHSDGARNYRIPADNPFIDLPNTRGEIWAYGFRNPWRMSFDRKTGDLWVGDVGWELWELMDRVERGGNYGWAVMEGRQPANPEWPRGPSPILPPTIDHPHSESSSITDGLTYYGTRLPQLHGMHIYGDYDTGKFWGFRDVEGEIRDHQELADTAHRVVGFGEDDEGDFYFLDHTAGTIHTLIPNPAPPSRQSFPRKLSDSGLFSSMVDRTPAAGVYEYEIIAQPWEDHATAKRLVGLPGEQSIAVGSTPWVFPVDSVLVKTLSLEMVQGDAASRRVIETQILHFDGSEWQPYTFQWNDEQTDAELVDAGGSEREFEIVDATAPGGKRKQPWRFSGRAECQRCHNKWSGPVLGFTTAQLASVPSSAASGPQLSKLADLQLLDELPAASSHTRLADPRDAAAPLNDRARAYLHTNCAHCHRQHAGSAVLSKMHVDLPLEKTAMIGERPTQGTFGIPAAEVIAPGDPFRSVLLYRMSKLGGGRMPHIGSNQVDLAGVGLICDWITQLPTELTQRNSADHREAKQRARQLALLDDLQDAEPATQASLLEQLLSSTTGAMVLLRAIDEGALAAETTRLAVQSAIKSERLSIQDLFQRFLPDEQRIQRLGSVIDADQILALPGDVGRGKGVFFHTPGVQCKNCHRIGEVGAAIGPDLTTIGKKYDRSQLLESILEPSRLIEPQYVTYLAETKDGHLLTGVLVKNDASEVVLKDAQNKLLRVARDELEQLLPQRLSLMPELLLRDMTARQVADLLAYLHSLR